MKTSYPLNVHEFGRENETIMVLIHPSVVRWDYFERVIPLLEKHCRLIIPALPGYDLESESEFSSVEEVATQIAAYLKENGIEKVHIVYGCSAGGSIALRMALDETVKIEHIIMDGGITPYQLPWIFTRLILLRDFAMLALGKWGGKKILMRAFNHNSYGEEDLRYVADVLRNTTYKTLWRTFDSCNNYKMPKTVMRLNSAVHYWCAEHERKQRSWDIKYMKKFIPDTQFTLMEGVDHGGLALLAPQRFADALLKMLEQS